MPPLRLTQDGPGRHWVMARDGQGPGDEHTMHSVPGRIAERDSQARIQVGPHVPVDSQP